MAAPLLDAVRAAIARAARTAGREAGDISLVAVSKTHGADGIVPLLAAGQRDFGENRIQEAAAKWPALREEWPESILHFVGRLQSNKAQEAVSLCDAVHSIDRASLVEALGRAQDKAGRHPACFIQVNIGDEAQKAGCRIGDLPGLLGLARTAGLDVSGLMCLPPEGLEPAPYFALLAKLGRDNGVGGLSMGMSGDYETAVKIGATHVRVGTALFGAREG